MFISSGTIRYSHKDCYKAILEVEDDLARYYYSLIPKYCRIQRPRYKPHVTVVRINQEMPTQLKYWGKYEGDTIVIRYSGDVKFDNNYYWIPVWSTELEKIRRELGLPDTSRFVKPPTGFKKNFHCTIANTKF